MGSVAGKSLSDIPRCANKSLTLEHVGSWLLKLELRIDGIVVDNADEEHWRLFKSTINTR
jgi:hypothetical protein